MAYVPITSPSIGPARPANDLQEYVDLLVTLTAKVATDGTLLVVGRPAEIASGWPLERLVGHSFLDGPWWTFDPEVHARVQAAFARARAGETVRYEERIFILGGVHVLELSLVPALDPEGKTRYIIAEGIDITALKAAQEEAIREKKRLNATVSGLETFSYTVSHDVRAPLRGIVALVETLEEEAGSALDENARRTLDRIRKEATRVAMLTSDLLVFSRLEHADLHVSDVDLTAIAEETLAQLARASPGRLVEAIVAPGLRARGSESLLRIALENLVRNAWKFTAPREVARIEVGRDEKGFFVRDNGVGFDGAKASQLFEPFRRLHSTHDFEGSGIGLATVRRIVERHGGTVAAEGKPGEGATFWFSLGDAS